MNLHLSKNICLIICVIFHKKTEENFKILMKNRHLGRSLQISAYLLDFLSNIPSSETNNFIINVAFVTILNNTILFMKNNLILVIKTSHCIIDFRETDC